MTSCSADCCRAELARVPARVGLGSVQQKDTSSFFRVSRSPLLFPTVNLKIVNQRPTALDRRPATDGQRTTGTFGFSHQPLCKAW